MRRVRDHAVRTGSPPGEGREVSLLRWSGSVGVLDRLHSVLVPWPAGGEVNSSPGHAGCLVSRSVGTHGYTTSQYRRKARTVFSAPIHFMYFRHVHSLSIFICFVLLLYAGFSLMFPIKSVHGAGRAGK